MISVMTPENLALSHHKNKLHFKIYSNRKQLFKNCNHALLYYCYYCIFDQINGEHKDPSLKINTYMNEWMQSLPTPFFNGSVYKK